MEENKQSHNVLVIKQITIQIERDEFTFTHHVKLYSEIQFHCPVTGNKFGKLSMQVEAMHPDIQKSFLMCMERFFNYERVVSTIHYFNVPRKCDLDKKHVHHVDYSLVQDPEWRLFFEQMFSKNNNSIILVN